MNNRLDVRYLISIILLTACAARSSQSTIPAETRNEALMHFARGDTFEQIAADFRLGNSADARELVHDALDSVNKRYYGVH